MQPDRKTQKEENSEGGVFQEDGIKNLDIMGEKFKFNYKREGGKYQTRLGGCLTIIVTALALMLLVFTSRQYFDTSSPSVTTTRELSSSQSFNVVGKNFFAGFLVYDGDSMTTNFSHFMTLRVKLMRKSFDPQKNTTKTEPIKTINYIPCDQSKDQSIIDLLKKMIDDIILSQYICPVFEELDNNVTLSSDPLNLSSTYLSLKVYPCSLADRSQCTSSQPWDFYTVFIPQISNLVSPTNYENPVAFNWKLLSYPFDMIETRFYI